MFMSMGEPFLNFANLEEAIERLYEMYPNAQNPAGQDDIGGGCGQLWYFQDWLKKNKINSYL